MCTTDIRVRICSDLMVVQTLMMERKVKGEIHKKRRCESDFTVVCDQYEWSKLKDFGASFGFFGFNIAGEKGTGKKPLIQSKEIVIFI